MRTKAIESGALSVILAALTRENRLACLVALATGLRVSDVLDLRREKLEKERFSVVERKTGKRKYIRLPPQLRKELLKISGKVFIFPNRLNEYKTRTRQTVWKDLHRAAKLLRLKGLGTHSMRKTYAVELRKMGFNASHIQKALNHTDYSITMLYAYADELSLR